MATFKIKKELVDYDEQGHKQSFEIENGKVLFSKLVMIVVKMS